MIDMKKKMNMIVTMSCDDIFWYNSYNCYVVVWWQWYWCNCLYLAVVVVVDGDDDDDDGDDDDDDGGDDDDDDVGDDGVDDGVDGDCDDESGHESWGWFRMTPCDLKIVCTDMYRPHAGLLTIFWLTDDCCFMFDDWWLKKMRSSTTSLHHRAKLNVSKCLGEVSMIEWFSVEVTEEPKDRW